MHGTHNVKK
jgi:hypothetical protein